jgi:hypothetical protein
MTVQVEAAELVHAIEVASVVGSIVAMLVVGLVLYLLVRPSRRRREPPPAAEPALEAEMLRLMERMEHRLEILERAVAGRAADEERLLQAGGQGPETRRRK